MPTPSSVSTSLNTRLLIDEEMMNNKCNSDDNDGKYSKHLVLPRRTAMALTLGLMMVLVIAGALLYRGQEQGPISMKNHHRPPVSSSLTSLLRGDRSVRPFTTLLPPMTPRLAKPEENEKTTTISVADAHQALQDLFQQHVNPTTGWIEVSQKAAQGNPKNRAPQQRITELRSLARAIMMGRNTSCGKPTVMPTDTTRQSLSSLSEYCFWDGDLVSQKALQNFSFERPLWRFVIRQFLKVLEKHNTRDDAKGQHHQQQWAFLDLGVNVGDWASPILQSLTTHSNFAYYGVEGSPPTAALAAANMLTALASDDNNNNKATEETASAYLFPYPLLSWRVYQQAYEDGGVCFSHNEGNVGGQGVPPPTKGRGQKKQTQSLAENATPLQNLTCAPNLAAGAAYFPQVAQAVATTYQHSQDPWPQFYIAKLDIQDFEFKTLSSAVEWLQRRPPCYIVIEGYPPVSSQFTSHMWALWEILLDAGYDALWRGHDMFRANFKGEFPDQPPFWKAGDDNGKKTLYQAWEEDLEGRNWWAYRDYILGFQDEEACIDRLMSTSTL